MAAAKEELSAAQNVQRQNGAKLRAAEKPEEKRNGAINTLLRDVNNYV
jgi:hypothetical protein